MRLIELCVQHAVPVLVAVLLAMLFGVIAIVGIPRELTPTVDVPVIGASVRYLGAAPQEIESEIVDKIEEQLNAVDGLREMTSESRDSMASVRLEFDWGTNLDIASIDVINKLNLVSDLPDEADDPVLFFGEERGHPICFLTLTGSGKKSDDLREFAKDTLQPFLKRVPGVSRVEVYGGRERHVEAVFDPYQLASFQLTPLGVSQMLARENQNTRGGRIEEDKDQWIVRTAGEFRTARDVENVVLRRPGMPDVRTGELLKVSQQSFKDAEYYVRIDGQEGIVFAVQKKTGQNVVAIMKGVYETIDKLNREILERQGLKMEVVYDESTYIADSIGLLQENVYVCAILAGAVLIFFLRDWRAVLTICISIPLSFVSTFIVLWMLGRSLNVVSLAGLAFAVGMLVDNSIVVLENIYRHREMGKSAARAALDGAVEVWLAVLASTLTTVAVFVPVIFIQEEAGQLFRDVSLAIAISVSISLVVSVTVIPMLSAKILRSSEGFERAGRRTGWDWVLHYLMFGWIGSSFRTRTVQLVGWILDSTARRVVTISLIVGVCGVLLWLAAANTAATYLPTGNRNFVLGFVVTEAGAGVEHNLQVAKDIENRLRPLPQLEHFFIVTMGDQIFFGARAADANKARWLASAIQARLGSGPPSFLPPAIRQKWTEKYGAFYQDPIAGVQVYAAQVGLFQSRGMLGGQTIDITVRGDDIDRLYAIAGAIIPRLQKIEGVFFVNPSFKLGKWELRPTVDRRRAADVGLAASDVGYSVLALMSGAKVADFREESGKEIDLTLRADGRYREHIETLADVPLWTPRGGIVSLGQIAPLKPEAGFNVIQHSEQQRSVTLETALQQEVPIGAVIDGIRNNILKPLEDDKTIPTDYVVDLRGTARDLDRMWIAIRWSLLLALLITYLLMAALFESFVHPFVIMLTVPLGMVGGYGMLYVTMFWNILVTGEPPPQLDVVTMLGFIILIGIVVNNAILVVAQALNFHQIDRLPMREAIVKSVDSRIRPIFMSTLTSILGMLPLVFRPGPGSELYQGLGAVVVGGLLISTVFTLILTPVVFSFAYRVTDVVRGLAVRWGLIVGSEDPASPAPPSNA